ncbi:MAG: MFS transporter [Thermomicrobiales bacterium]
MSRDVSELAGSRDSGTTALPHTTPSHPAAAATMPAIIVVALGTMLAPLNSTMIAVALPWIGRDFGASVATTSWLVIAYLVAMAGIQPAAGTLGDRLGRRPLVLGGLIAFGVASAGAALSPTLPLLIVARVCQAAAGAVLVPNGTALVRELVPQAERARRFGQIGAAISCAAAVGPPLGGVLIASAGWRAVFAANIALIAPALWLGWRALPVTTRVRERRPFDLAGAVVLAALLCAVAATLTRWPAFRQQAVAAQLAIAGLLAAGVIGFVRYELRHAAPALPPRLFVRRGFAAATAANALSNLALYVTLLATPILLARRGGWSSATIGLLLATLSGATVLASPLGGRLADRLGRRWPAVLGLALLTAGVVPLALGGGAVALPALLTGLPLAGAGLGLASAALQTGALESVAPRQTGAAAGVFSTGRYLGSIVGSSVLGGLLGAGNDLRGFAAVFLLVAVAAGLSALAAFGLQDWPGRETPGGAQTPITS